MTMTYYAVLSLGMILIGFLVEAIVIEDSSENYDRLATVKDLVSIGFIIVGFAGLVAIGLTKVSNFT